MGQTQSASPSYISSHFFISKKHTRNECIVLVNTVVNGDIQQTIHLMIVITVWLLHIPHILHAHTHTHTRKHTQDPFWIPIADFTEGASMKGSVTYCIFNIVPIVSSIILSHIVVVWIVTYWIWFSEKYHIRNKRIGCIVRDTELCMILICVKYHIRLSVTSICRCKCICVS